MGDYHRLLKRQIRRHLRLDAAYATELQVKLEPFLKAVSLAYQQSDEDRQMLDRALQLSSRELFAANSEMRTILAALPDQYLVMDGTGLVISYHPGNGGGALAHWVSPIGKHLSDIFDGEAASKAAEALSVVAKTGKVHHLEVSSDHSGTLSSYEVRILPVDKSRFIALVRDISERKQTEMQIEFLAYHDSLTSLPNRLLFRSRLGQALEHAKAQNQRVAVMFMDLDRFKYINDTFGHSLGDQLLVTIAKRLRNALRQSDMVGLARSGPTPFIQGENTESTIARMGGDEFTVILSEVAGPESVMRVAERILQAISGPISLGGVEVFTSASIGAAIFPDDGEEIETLLRNADAAMYDAKEKGKNNCQIYDQAMNAKALRRLRIENDLRRALLNEELTLYYQPVVNSSDVAIRTLEVLLRWIHPSQGFIAPDEFIPIAEETGLILEIGQYVLERACAQVSQWRKNGFPELAVSVNLSGQHFDNKDLLKYVNHLLEKYDLPASALGLEITETAMLKNSDIAFIILGELKQMGVTIYLDDFGTGYSSLSYLKRLPVNIVKIDRSFIRDVITDQDDAALTKGIIAIAHTLGLKVVAEGVEDREQLQFVRDHSCDFAQGYYICRPTNAEKITEFLKQKMLAA